MYSEEKGVVTLTMPIEEYRFLMFYLGQSFMEKMRDGHPERAQQLQDLLVSIHKGVSPNL